MKRKTFMKYWKN